MHRDSERLKLFNRRVALLAGGKVLLLSGLIGRMYYLQVVEADRYATLADENRINLRLLLPPRGPIVDRFGRPLAVNRQNYRSVLVPEQTPSVETTLERLGEIVAISASDKRRILREIRRKRAFVPVTVRDNLDWSEVSRIEVNTPDLPGVMIDEGQSRKYIDGREVAHVIGYVSSVSEKDISSDPLMELPGFRIGKAGVEKVYDLALRGTGGSSQVEVNALGRVIRELSRQEGQPGVDLQLTIDIELQRMVNKRLAGQSAACVVLDIHTGDVLAMSSTPSFDPNAFNRGLSNQEWQDLVTNPMAPLTNKAIAGQYSPGSTFKMVVALAALEKGVISSTNELFCSGSLTLGNAVFHCWKRSGHGRVDMRKAITQSCDVYFYEVARRLGIDAISAMANRLGMGAKLGIDLPGENTGLMPTRKWKMGAMGTSWQTGETLIAGIGQGYVLTTPLQLAVMTARLANGGIAVTPHLAHDIVTPEKVTPRKSGSFPSIGLDPDHLKVVLEGMTSVVNSPYGTAHRSRIDVAGMEMAGKSGTVQVRRITKLEREQGVRKNKDLAWLARDHALFVAYAPIQAPRYAVSVVVEHGGGGSSVAAPIAHDVLLEAQKRKSARPAVIERDARNYHRVEAEG